MNESRTEMESSLYGRDARRQGRVVGSRAHRSGVLRQRATLIILALLHSSILPFSSGCYGFRGGSAPAGISTVIIPQVEDASGSGRATMRQDLTGLLVRKFREDNSLRVVDDPAADSRLEVTLTVVRDRERLAVGSGQELETVRGVTIEARAIFRDNIRRRAIFERAFNAKSQYNVDEGVAGEADAIATALDQLSTDILLASVAQW